jgi:CBS domain-containing membrane protein
MMPGDFLRRFLPDVAHVPLAERLRSGLAALLAVAAVTWMADWLVAPPVPLIAAIGASSALVFALPMSPLSQPWAVVVGYVVCALAGVLAARWVPGVALAAGVAVGAAIFGMLVFRCMHPPGGAVALFAVIGGDGIRALGFQYVLTPVLVNALLLVATALMVNNLLPGRHYPKRAVPAHVHAGGFTGDDLKSALRDYDHPLAASEEEFDAIIALAERKAAERRR